VTCHCTLAGAALFARALGRAGAVTARICPTSRLPAHDFFVVRSSLTTRRRGRAGTVTARIYRPTSPLPAHDLWSFVHHAPARMAAPEIVCLAFGDSEPDVARLCALAETLRVRPSPFVDTPFNSLVGHPLSPPPLDPSPTIIAVSNKHEVSTIEDQPFTHLDADFKTPRGLLRCLSPATRIVVLDFFWIPPLYFAIRYGTNWLTEKLPQCFSSFPRLETVVLPVDKFGGAMAGMLANPKGQEALRKAGIGVRRMSRAEAERCHPLVLATARAAEDEEDRKAYGLGEEGWRYVDDEFPFVVFQRLGAGSAGGLGPAASSAGATGPAVSSAGATGPAASSAGATGPAVSSAGATGPAVSSAGAAEPASPAGAAEPASPAGAAEPASPAGATEPASPTAVTAVTAAAAELGVLASLSVSVMGSASSPSSSATPWRSSRESAGSASPTSTAEAGADADASSSAPSTLARRRGAESLLLLYNGGGSPVEAAGLAGGEARPKRARRG
jgi:hypothetical protein